MNVAPTFEVLDQKMTFVQRPAALHEQVRDLLRVAIHEHFEDGQTFWTERLLMERLGVSRGTVRQALGELTREGLLVREASRRTFVRKAVVTSIGVVFTRYESDFLVELLQKVAVVCLERELHLELYPTVSHAHLEDTIANIRRPPHEERLILLGEHHERDLFLHDGLAAHGYRTVSVGAATINASIAAVDTDSEAAVGLAVEHLLGLGHRSIVFLVNEPISRGVVERKVREFERLKQQLGFEGRAVISEAEEGKSSFDVAYKLMPRLWNEARPTGIFTASDPGAWAALRWFHEQGIKVPDQVSVVGFEGVKPDAFTYPPLTTVAHSMAELVNCAFEMLWQDDITAQQQWVAPHLVVRQSTGPCSHQM